MWLRTDGVEARPRPGRMPAVVEAEVTGDSKSDELTEWHGLGWIHRLDMAP